MKVFLVRHGISEAFDEEKWQTPKSSLSKLGRNQALALAKHSRFQIVDAVLSSKWPRAKETAEITAEFLGKPLKFFNELHEREQNPQMYGVKWTSKLHHQFHEDFSKSRGNLDWKFKDMGESLRDVSNRAIKFKKHLLRNYEKQNFWNFVITYFFHSYRNLWKNKHRINI